MLSCVESTVSPSLRQYQHPLNVGLHSQQQAQFSQSTPQYNHIHQIHCLAKPLSLTMPILSLLSSRTYFTINHLSSTSCSHHSLTSIASTLRAHNTTVVCHWCTSPQGGTTRISPDPHTHTPWAYLGGFVLCLLD